MYSAAKNPVWANEEKTFINVEVNFNHVKEEFVWFTTSKDADTADGQSIFEEVMAGKYGIIGDYVPPPPPTSEELAIQIRADRDTALSATDWTQLPDVPQSTKDLYASYRQALRDLTSQAGFPNDIVWPELPK